MLFQRAPLVHYLGVLPTLPGGESWAVVELQRLNGEPDRGDVLRHPTVLPIETEEMDSVFPIRVLNSVHLVIRETEMLCDLSIRIGAQLQRVYTIERGKIIRTKKVIAVTVCVESTTLLQRTIHGAHESKKLRATVHSVEALGKSRGTVVRHIPHISTVIRERKPRLTYLCCLLPSDRATHHLIIAQRICPTLVLGEDVIIR